MTENARLTRSATDSTDVRSALTRRPTMARVVAILPAAAARWEATVECVVALAACLPLVCRRWPMAILSRGIPWPLIRRCMLLSSSTAVVDTHPSSSPPWATMACLSRVSEAQPLKSRHRPVAIVSLCRRLTHNVTDRCVRCRLAPGRWLHVRWRPTGPGSATDAPAAASSSGRSPELLGAPRKHVPILG